ncbi:acyl carrier protein [Pseudomonadota bacterium]
MADKKAVLTQLEDEVIDILAECCDLDPDDFERTGRIDWEDDDSDALDTLVIAIHRKFGLRLPLRGETTTPGTLVAYLVLNATDLPEEYGCLDGYVLNEEYR